MIILFLFSSLFILALSPPSSLPQTDSLSEDMEVDMSIHDQLVKACRNSYYHEIPLLLSQGANINYADKNGFTPLYWALFNLDKHCLQILIDHNVDVNKAITPEATYLKKRGNKKNSPLFLTVMNDKISFTQMLLEAGADPNVEYQEGWTCLTYAIWYSHYGTVELLLKFGADVNQSSQMGSPLYLASFGSKLTESLQKTQSVELVRELLLRGADPNNIAQKTTPFGFNSAKTVHFGLGKEILFHYSPLQIALGFREWDIAMLLIDFGADVTYKNVLGETAIHLMMQPLKKIFSQRSTPPLSMTKA